jgi:hypothetical protein
MSRSLEPSIDQSMSWSVESSIDQSMSWSVESSIDQSRNCRHRRSHIEHGAFRNGSEASNQSIVSSHFGRWNNRIAVDAHHWGTRLICLVQAHVRSYSDGTPLSKRKRHASAGVHGGQETRGIRDLGKRWHG